jgi:carbonic anhydrase
LWGVGDDLSNPVDDRHPDAALDAPGYREALIEAAVFINAAQAAFDLRQGVQRAAKWEIEVLYGVHNIRNHQVCMPVDPLAPRSDENVRLAQAPNNPKEFRALAIQMAELLKPPGDTVSLTSADGHPGPSDVRCNTPTP